MVISSVFLDGLIDVLVVTENNYNDLQTTFEDSEKTAMRAEWERGRIFDREVAGMFLERIKVWILDRIFYMVGAKYWGNDARKIM